MRMIQQALAHPPIDEVVCGVIFEAIEHLTPALHGLYWSTREDVYPRHEIYPAVEDESQQLYLGTPPLRTWLLTEDDTRVVQVQRDRMYVNWRRRKEEEPYPRFSSHAGRPGILDFAIGEYSTLLAFLSSRDIVVKPTAVELAKFDLLVQEKHWTSPNDLAALLPALSCFVVDNTLGDVSVRSMRAVDDITIAVTIVTARHRVTGQTAVRLETRTRANISDTGADAIRAKLAELNTVNNEQFLRLIPYEQQDRFQ